MPHSFSSFLDRRLYEEAARARDSCVDWPGISSSRPTNSGAMSTCSTRPSARRMCPTTSVARSRAISPSARRISSSTTPSRSDASKNSTRLRARSRDARKNRDRSSSCARSQSASLYCTRRCRVGQPALASTNHVGPFVNKDGRRFWFDFYRVAKLTALVRAGDLRAGVALQGSSAAPQSRRTSCTREGRDRVQTREGKHLDQCALPDHWRTRGLVRRFDYRRRSDCGERDPSTQNGQLTVPANATVSVQLELAQAPVTNADDTSPYGADARDLQLDLPRTFAFHFSAQGHAIDAVGDARWDLYGQELQFTRRSNDAASYDPLPPASARAFCPLRGSAPDPPVLDPSSMPSEAQRISSEAPGRSRSRRSTSRSRPRRRARAPCWSKRTRGCSTRGRSCRVGR